MSKKKATSISLPMSRTMKIMTSAVNVETVTQDAVAIATKATEIFLTDFARRAYELSDSNILDYDDITRLVHSDPRYDFIVDTTPKRIKFSEALKLIEQSKKRGPLLDDADDQLGNEIDTKSEAGPEKEPDATSTTHETKEQEEEEEEDEEEEDDDDEEEQRQKQQNGDQASSPDSSNHRNSVESPPPDDQ